MTDLTDNYISAQDETIVRNSDGVQLANTIEKEEVDTETARVKAKGEVAYDATDLNSVGPSKEDYDYEGQYAEGNTYKSDADSGINLKNKGYKTGTASIMGRDLNSGRNYTKDEWAHWECQNIDWDDLSCKDSETRASAEKDIEEGRKILSEGEYNTITGSSYDQTDGLFKVANGVLKGGGTFEDFASQVHGPWSNEMIGIGWNASQTTRDVMAGIDDMGKGNYEAMVEARGQADYDAEVEAYNKFEGVTNAIPAEGYTEETLVANADWIANARTLGSFFFGKENVDQKSDAEVANANKMFMAMNTHSLDMMIFAANRIIQANDPELARAWLTAYDQYDALEMSGASVGRAVSSQFNIRTG